MEQREDVQILDFSFDSLNFDEVCRSDSCGDGILMMCNVLC